MDSKLHLHRIAATMVLLALTACRVEPTPPPAPPPTQPAPLPGTPIGTTGGTVTGPATAQVVIPAGALTTETRILIEETTAGIPALPAGYVAAGSTFAFTPHGTVFATAATASVPFDPTRVPAGSTPQLFKTTASNQWEQVTHVTLGAASVSGPVTRFSLFVVVVPPVTAAKTAHQWQTDTLHGDALTTTLVASGDTVAQHIVDSYDLGPASRDGPVFASDGSIDRAPDGIATAQIIAAADGSDFWLGVEAPRGVAAIATDAIGNSTVFHQTQTFIKRAADASLTFTLSRVFLQTSDANGVLNRACPGPHTIGLFCDMINAAIHFDAEAFTVPEAPFTRFETFLRVAGTASLTGIADSWHSDASTESYSMRPLWTRESFGFSMEPIEGHAESLITMQLPLPLPFRVDLSSIEIGQKFTVKFLVILDAYNRAAAAVSGQGAEFETSARAYLSNPLQIEGTSVTHTGLEPVDAVTQGPPPVAPLPIACPAPPNPNPSAGTLQFSAADYTQAESAASPVVRVTRTGGTVGAVSATFATSNGTAIAGTDYTAVTTTVLFADGDASPRGVAVPVIQDATHSEPDKTVNLTLSQPGGCAALGAQSTAVLTLHDDDTPPPPTLFTVGGTVTGLTGNGLVLENHRGLLLAIAGNGPFTFSDIPSPAGTSYFVRVFNQPRNALGFQTQRCTVVGGTGVFANANVTNVIVVCEDL